AWLAILRVDRRLATSQRHPRPQEPRGYRRPRSRHVYENRRAGANPLTPTSCQYCVIASIRSNRRLSHRSLVVRARSISIMSILASLEERALAELNGCADEAALRVWHTKYFGKQGEMTWALKRV